MAKLILAIAAAILLCSRIRVSSSSKTLNSTTDLNSLLAFKTAITSDPFNILATNWSINAPLCSWIGVTCSSSHHRVTSLKLPGFGLVGTLPPHIGNLSFLKAFDISSNSFTGPLPSEFSHLRRLMYINIQQNVFTGQIPSWLGSLPELGHIILDNNSFSGSISPAFCNNTKMKTLNMSGNSLVGTIPQEIANLSSLQMINLDNNGFGGSIPFGLFYISTLKEIVLSRNKLSGCLPRDICTHMVQLKTLILTKNQLEGQIPANLMKCRDLNDLRLDFNQFNGSIPVEIEGLRMLRILHLGNNNLRGSIPKQFGNLTALKFLYLNDNSLTGELPSELGTLELEELVIPNNSITGRLPDSICNMSTLKALSISFNYISGSLPSTMGYSLSNMRGLYLGSNKLTGNIPKAFNNASALIVLDMSNNAFSGPVPNFGNFRHLKFLSLAKNKLTGESTTEEMGLFTSLVNCHNLVLLDVMRNPLNSVIPTAIGNISASIEVFSAARCNLKGVVPGEIGNLTSLLHLSLTRNNLTGLIPRTIGNLKNLQELYIDYSQVEGCIPYEICHLTRLGTLSLSGNMLNCPIPECFGELQGLQEVYIDSNKLNSSLPSNFWNLNDLIQLDLSSNFLSGNLSAKIGSLRVLHDLDLSSNQFSGSIPASIGGCQTLDFISLANNKFEGLIPRSLGNLKSLSTLNLSHNNLSGILPKPLEDLEFLEHFNVSYNRLEGEIPNRGPFLNFTAQSFYQNLDLCGEARFNVPPCMENRKSRTIASLMKYVLPPIISSIVLVIFLQFLLRRNRRNRIPPNNNDSMGQTPWRRVSYQVLLRGTNAFSEASKIGSGSFGSVFKGTLHDGLTVAVKVFNMDLEGAAKSFDSECKILSMVRHRNLVPILGCCSSNEFKALVLEYMTNGSLEKWLYTTDHFLDMLQRLNIAIDVALGLEHLHDGHTFPVVHCDIKPSNILLDEDMMAYVGDFGIAKLFANGEAMIQTNTLGTLGYMAPEFGSDGKVSTSGDVYSYGIMLLEMFTGKRPTDGAFSENMSLKDWVSTALHEDRIIEVLDFRLLETDDEAFSSKEQCAAAIFDLALKCLSISPEDRVTMVETAAALRKIKVKFQSDKKDHINRRQRKYEVPMHSTAV